MKWFNREWQSGALSDIEVEAVNSEYSLHLGRIKHQLPPDLRALAEAGGTTSLHDGRFIDAQWKVGHPDVLLLDIAAWTADGRRLVGNAWDEPRIHVRLAYQGAELMSPGRTELQTIIRDPKTEILWGEVDIDKDGVLEHRMLLWPAELPEFSIRFRSIELAIVRFIDGRAELLYPPAS